MVSSACTTGAVQGIDAPAQTAYFRRIQAMNLRQPRLIGFGINDKYTFNRACQYASGAIIGSAFIRHLASEPVTPSSIEEFVGMIRGQVLLDAV